MPINLKTFTAVSAFIVNDKDEVLLLKRNEIVYHGHWQFPEGKIGKGETEIQAIRRELNEEIGLSKPEISFLTIHICPYVYRGFSVKLKRKIYKVDAPRKITLSSEHSEYGWFSKNDLQQMKLVPGVAEIVSNILKLPQY